MTGDREWRALTAAEQTVLIAVISNAKVPAKQALLDELDGAVASNSTQWILDIRATADRPHRITGRTTARTHLCAQQSRLPRRGHRLD